MIREIEAKTLSDTVRELCIQANTVLPQDLRQAICAAREEEPSPVGQAILEDLRANYEFAQEKGLPICQDTGMAVVFLDWGQDCHLIGGSLEEAVNDGVARGYLEGHLRLSVVADPLRRVNTENNTPAVLHLRMVSGDRVDVTVAPKGFGSENMTRLKMWGWGWGAPRRWPPCWPSGPCCVRRERGARTPSTGRWRGGCWSGSTLWASVLRGWAGGPRPCPWLS